MTGLIIEPHYLANLQYFSKFLICNCIIFDDESLFRKQSFRNRTHILSANGILPLIVPVCKGRSKIAFKDIRIDSSILWQKNHWHSIVSAYNKSAYFEYYLHYFEGYYKKPYAFLIDLNLDMIKTISKILSLKTDIILLSEFDGKIEELTDLRNCIDPKVRFNKNDDFFTPIQYSQVFADRLDFKHNLSIIDLLFNFGPDALSILKKCSNLPS